MTVYKPSANLRRLTILHTLKENPSMSAILDQMRANKAAAEAEYAKAMGILQNRPAGTIDFYASPYTHLPRVTSKVTIDTDTPAAFDAIISCALRSFQQHGANAVAIIQDAHDEGLSILEVTFAENVMRLWMGLKSGISLKVEVDTPEPKPAVDYLAITRAAAG